MEEVSQPARVYVVLHCEFSKSRAPQYFSTLRRLDTALHPWPASSPRYPDLYVMDGGYRKWVTEYKELCQPPGGYVEMNHRQWREECGRGLRERSAEKRAVVEHMRRQPLAAGPMPRRPFSGHLLCLPSPPPSPLQLRASCVHTHFLASIPSSFKAPPTPSHHPSPIASVHFTFGDRSRAYGRFAPLSNIAASAIKLLLNATDRRLMKTKGFTVHQDSRVVTAPLLPSLPRDDRGTAVVWVTFQAPADAAPDLHSITHSLVLHHTHD